MHEKTIAPDEDLDASLHAIEEAYIASLPGRLKDIGDSLQRCLDAPHTAAHFEALLLQLHSLSGSAGTFGFSDLGMRATELEIRLGKALKEKSAGLDAAAGIMPDVAALLRWAVSDANIQSKAAPTAVPAAVPAESPAVAANGRLIYLVHDDPQLARDIAGQIEYFGYEVEIVGELRRLQACIDHRPPSWPGAGGGSSCTCSWASSTSSSA